MHRATNNNGIRDEMEGGEQNARKELTFGFCFSSSLPIPEVDSLTSNSTVEKD